MQNEITTKEQGIKKVVDNNPTDHEKILDFACDWVKIRMRSFTCDDLRRDYEAINTPPAQPKIYGGVFNSLVKENRILPNGFSSSTRPEAHGRILRMWISAEYSKQQSNNRKGESNQPSLFEL